MRETSIESGDGVRILKNAWYHLSTQPWHHSPVETLQHAHELITAKIKEVREEK